MNVTKDVQIIEAATMPYNFAGSAIAQGRDIGQINRLSSWKPTAFEPLWLLLSGATDPPKYIYISDRRTRHIPGVSSGTFLPGVNRDLTNVEDAVGTKLFNTVKDLYLTKSAALEHITKLFEKCKSKMFKPMLYYTGHGEIGTGNWCFADGTISIQEIFNMVPVGMYYPMVFSDACYSGHWANFCLHKDIAGFHCLAACPEYSTAIDTKVAAVVSFIMASREILEDLIERLTSQLKLTKATLQSTREELRDLKESLQIQEREHKRVVREMVAMTENESKLVGERDSAREAAKKAWEKVAEMEARGEFGKRNIKEQSASPMRMKPEKFSGSGNDTD
ncbi:hypothetical protein OS493_038347 [Desmophyllum pertusum]|uniref:Uncharacterized protein n=1 Tax=Desmophyllum pertusum TaxID=174260 RepID=A0A9X0CNF0_9CNID|nr:hypothetical protein OS493_038347 [Desmophyllum pertusum]